MEALFESERKVMEILWDRGPLTAKEVARIAGERVGWNKNTTYTVIKKLVEKGVVRREEPGFLCTPLVTRAAAQRTAVRGLLQTAFGGSRKALFSALLEEEALDDAERADLLALIEKR